MRTDDGKDRARRLSRASAPLTFLLLAALVALGPRPLLAAAGDIAIDYRQGHLWLEAEEAPLIAVLEQVSAVAGFSLEVHETPEALSSWSIAGLPLDEALRRLLRDVPALWRHELESGDPTGAETPPLEALVLLARAEEVAITPELSDYAYAPASGPSPQELAERRSLAAPREERLARLGELAADPQREDLALLRRHLSDDSDPTARRLAASALAGTPTIGARDALIGALIDEDPLVRQRAVIALTQWRDERAREGLRTALAGDDDARVRSAAARALSRSGGDGAADALESARADPDPQVRRAAERALVRLARASGQ
ncbi:MAG: HEAT repeat domain-containing protein [Planctomycetota bacterium]